MIHHKVVLSLILVFRWLLYVHLTNLYNLSNILRHKVVLFLSVMRGCVCAGCFLVVSGVMTFAAQRHIQKDAASYLQVCQTHTVVDPRTIMVYHLIAV